MSASLDPSTTHAPAFFVPPSATDEEGFLAALVGLPPLSRMSVSPILACPIALNTTSPLYTAPGSHSDQALSLAPFTSASATATPASPSRSSVAGAMVSSASIYAAPSLAMTVSTVWTNISSSSSASALSSLSTYAPPESFSAYGGVAYSIVASSTGIWTQSSQLGLFEDSTILLWTFFQQYVWWYGRNWSEDSRVHPITASIDGMVGED